MGTKRQGRAGSVRSGAYQPHCFNLSAAVVPEIEDELRVAVAIDIGETRGLAEYALGDEVFFPAGVGRGGCSGAGVFIPESGMMEDAAEDEEIGATVAVKIGDEGEHRVRGVLSSSWGTGS